MNSNQELRRLRYGPRVTESIGGLGTVRFVVHCPRNADKVLNRAKEVLELVLSHSTDPGMTIDKWRMLLPEWFIGMCGDELTREEADKWLLWWKALSPQEQIRVEREQAWSLSDWLYWFKPEQREWHWWDATIENANTIRLAVIVEEWPFPWDALRWLFTASGASSLEPER
jgi:hypothetical protein